MTDEPIRSTGRFLNMSWGKKQEGKSQRKRYYFYIEDPGFAENSKFPFKEGETIAFEIQGSKVVIFKARVVKVIIEPGEENGQ